VQVRLELAHFLIHKRLNLGKKHIKGFQSRSQTFTFLLWCCKAEERHASNSLLAQSSDDKSLPRQILDDRETVDTRPRCPTSYVTRGRETSPEKPEGEGGTLTVPSCVCRFSRPAATFSQIEILLKSDPARYRMKVVVTRSLSSCA
jgi:hypothetical protein